MREFTLSYEFDQGCWFIAILAESEEDAERRLKAIRGSVELLGPTDKLQPSNARGKAKTFA